MSQEFKAARGDREVSGQNPASKDDLNIHSLGSHSHESGFKIPSFPVSLRKQTKSVLSLPERKSSPLKFPASNMLPSAPNVALS